eukprot:331161-Chlamydomonas_euryale.AAC.2
MPVRMREQRRAVLVWESMWRPHHGALHCAPAALCLHPEAASAPGTAEAGASTAQQSKVKKQSADGDCT